VKEKGLRERCSVVWEHNQKQKIQLALPLLGTLVPNDVVREWRYILSIVISGVSQKYESLCHTRSPLAMSRASSEEKDRI
jgi:hypothetical protein